METFTRLYPDRADGLSPVDVAADLPGPLDDDGRLVLVRRLVREGFLRRSAAGA